MRNPPHSTSFLLHRRAIPILVLLTLFSSHSWGSGEGSREKPGETNLLEQTIYVPYEKIEAVFEKKGRGVFLPYNEFLELWSHQSTFAAGKEKRESPVDGVPVRVEYTGKVHGNVAVIEALLEIRALKEGYSLVPLGVSHLSVSEANVIQATGEAARNSSTGGMQEQKPSGAFLLTLPDSLEGDQWKTWLNLGAGMESLSKATIQSATTPVKTVRPKAGDLAAILPSPGLYRFHLTLMIPVVDGPGGKYIEFKGPESPVSRFTLDVPAEAIEFELTPPSAFSHQPAGGGSTRLTAFFNGSDPIRIFWKPSRVEQERTALLFADLREKVTLLEGSTRWDTNLNLQVLLAGLDQVTLSLPAESQVLSVSATNLRLWETEEFQGGRKVVIRFHSSAKDSLHLAISYEIPVAAASEERLVPMLLVEGAQRQSGHIAIHVPPYLVVRPRQVEGLSQETIEAAVSGINPQAFGYRYLRVPYKLSFDLSKATPRIFTEIQSLVQIGSDKWVLQSRVRFDVRKAGVFRLELKCPRGFSDPEIIEEEVPVSDYRVVGEEGKRRIEIELKERRSGTFSLLLRCEKSWIPPAPDQSATEPIPCFIPLGADRIDGYLGVGVHESLAANIADLGGGRTEDIRNLTGLPNGDKAQPAPLTLGFRYRGETSPPALSFTRRKPRISAEVQTLIEIKEAFYEMTTHLAFLVEYAGVDEFSFRVPAEIADHIQIEGPAIKERTKEVKDNLATWKVVLQDKQTGKYELTLTYENPYSTVTEATTASRAEIEIPGIFPLNVFRSTGVLSFVKGGNLDITPTTQGLEAIDNKELPERLRPPGTFLAFRYDRGATEEKAPWHLGIAVERHAYIEVPTSVVRCADLQTVVNKEGHQVCLVTYYLQNKRAQYLELELPQDAQLLSEIFVGDKGEQPVMRANDKRILIRLGNVENPSASIPVQFAYEQAIPSAVMGSRGRFEIKPPQLSGTRILQTNWTLFLPEGYDYTRFDGLMVEAQRYRSGWHRWRRYLDWAVPTPGVGAPPVQVAPQPAAPSDTQRAASGPKVTIVEEGQRFQFHRLDSPAAVTVLYRRVAWSLVYEFIFFLLAILLGVFLVKRGRTKRLTYCVTAGILAVLASVLVSPRAVGPYESFYLGVLCLAIVWGVLSLVAFWPNRPWKRPQGSAITSEGTPPVPDLASNTGMIESSSSPSDPVGPESKEERDE
jgi:hypothetical protein